MGNSNKKLGSDLFKNEKDTDGNWDTDVDMDDIVSNKKISKIYKFEDFLGGGNFGNVFRCYLLTDTKQ